MFALLKKNLKLKLQKAQIKSIRFCLNLPPRSQTDPSQFRIINWLPDSNRVEYRIASTDFKCWNGVVPGYIYEMFKPSLCKYSTRRQMVLENTSVESKHRAKKLIFHRAKNMVQDPSIKKITTLPSFMHAIQKNILPHLQS